MNRFRDILLIRCLIFLISGLMLNQAQARPLPGTANDRFATSTLPEIADSECPEDPCDPPESIPLPSESPEPEDPASEEESVGSDSFKIASYDNDFQVFFQIDYNRYLLFSLSGYSFQTGEIPTPPPES